MATAQPTAQTVNVRRATAAAQALLQESNPQLIVDGKPGTYTTTTYRSAGSSLRDSVDQVVRVFGFPGGYEALNDVYRREKDAALSSSDNSAIFALQIVPAVIRRAKAQGINPVFPLTQLMIESGGSHTPMGADGKPSYNYGGIKWATVKTERRAPALTTEVVNGRTVKTVADFAAFNSGPEFVDAYFDYLFRRSTRYPGLASASSATEYGEILRKGGYATDPLYAKKFAKVSDQVVQRFGLIA